jgi:hypothetical protein
MGELQVSVMGVPAAVSRVMRMRVGSEVLVDGWVWFRIDSDEYKVHRPNEPDGIDSYWVAREEVEVANALESLNPEDDCSPAKALSLM